MRKLRFLVVLMLCICLSGCGKNAKNDYNYANVRYEYSTDDGWNYKLSFEQTILRNGDIQVDNIFYERDDGSVIYRIYTNGDPYIVDILDGEIYVEFNGVKKVDKFTEDTAYMQAFLCDYVNNNCPVEMEDKSTSENGSRYEGTTLKSDLPWEQAGIISIEASAQCYHTEPERDPIDKSKVKKADSLDTESPGRTFRWQQWDVK